MDILLLEIDSPLSVEQQQNELARVRENPVMRNNFLVSYKPFIVRYARRYAGPLFTPDEATKEGYLVANRCIDSYEPAGGAFIFYLRRSLRNHLIDVVERHEAEGHRPLRAFTDVFRDAKRGEHIPEPEAARDYADEEREAMVRAAVERLPEDEREVLRAVYWDDLSYTAYGVKRGVSHSSISLKHSQALRNLPLVLQHAV